MNKHYLEALTTQRNEAMDEVARLLADLSSLREVGEEMEKWRTEALTLQEQVNSLKRSCSYLEETVAKLTK